jgi:hypothetical protein
MGGPPKSAKDLGTLRTRSVHWLSFCVDLKLTDDLTLQHVPIERCVYQIAMYAVHLATGHSISCRAIKAATITKYLLAVAHFCARSNPRDPRKLEQTNKGLAPAIQGDARARNHDEK